MEKEKQPRFYLLDFCNGELMTEENFESSTLLEIYLTRHFIEDPIIIYGYNLTNYFMKGK